MVQLLAKVNQFIRINRKGQENVERQHFHTTATLAKRTPQSNQSVALMLSASRALMRIKILKL